MSTPAKSNPAKRFLALLLVLASLLPFVPAASAAGTNRASAGMVCIPAGVYHPLFQADSNNAVAVNAFYLDIVPVSNAEYLAFVRANPRWQRSEVKRVFADESYLKNWAGDLELGPLAPSDAPVVYVSWFAARAFAQWEGKRLPTIAEWERAAAASPTRADGNNDPNFKNDILRWYSESTATELLPVDRGLDNFYGVRSLHGLIWEWTGDFNSTFNNDVASDSRLFCGAGAQGSRDVDDYPAFMRFAFRSSLHANYCVHNLGFRCAKDL